MTQIQLAEWEWPESPRFLMCTPLSHAGAAFFAPTVIKGGSLYVLRSFDPAEVLEFIEREKITATMLVPSMLYALMDHPDSKTRDLSSLETVYYGASAINPVRLKEAIDRFGPIFAQYYGQSEAPMVITYFAKEDHVTGDDAPAVDVRPAVGVPAGRAARRGRQPGAAGRAGRDLRGRPPAVPAATGSCPRQTAETFRDGWMHTGDVAREDEDGFWYIVDRTKDMIVTGGFNVFPREVEDVVAQHPAIAQVGVIGTPDEKWGEAVTAIVVLREGHELTDDVDPRDPGHGQGAQGLGAVAQADHRHRRAAADRARQAGQEGAAGAVLDGRALRRLTERVPARHATAQRRARVRRRHQDAALADRRRDHGTVRRRLLDERRARRPRR